MYFFVGNSHRIKNFTRTETKHKSKINFDFILSLVRLLNDWITRGLN